MMGLILSHICPFFSIYVFHSVWVAYYNRDYTWNPREVRDEVGLRLCCLSFQVLRWRDFNITEGRFKELKHMQSQRLFCLEVFVCVTWSCHPKFENLYTTLLYVHIKYLLFRYIKVWNACRLFCLNDYQLNDIHLYLLSNMFTYTHPQ